jgi:hypothetical protein
VAEAPARLKEIAAYVAPSCDEAGMAMALRWLMALPGEPGRQPAHQAVMQGAK